MCVEWIILGQGKNEICFLWWLIWWEDLAGLRDAWIAGETLFWVCLWGCFWKRLALNQSADWVKKIHFHQYEWASSIQLKGLLNKWKLTSPKQEGFPFIDCFWTQTATNSSLVLQPAGHPIRFSTIRSNLMRQFPEIKRYLSIYKQSFGSISLENPKQHGIHLALV